MKQRILYFSIIVLFFLLNSCQKSANEYYNTAVDLTKSHNINETIEALNGFNIAIEIDSNFALAYLKRGRAKFEIQQYKIYLKSTNYFPKNPNPQLERIAIDTLFEGTINDYNKAQELNPTLAKESLIGKGDVFLYFKKYQNALSDFESALKIDSTDDRIIESATLCKLFLADTVGAIKLIDQLVNNNSNNPLSYYRRAVYRLTSFKNKEGGCEDLNKALKLYDNKKKYNYGNLKEEIEKLLKINCSM